MRIPDSTGYDPADHFEDQPVGRGLDLEWSAPTEGVHGHWYPWEDDEAYGGDDPDPPET
jgi:hypothetical protein